MASAKRMKFEFSGISEHIQKSTKKKLELFNSIRGKDITLPFWDIIVLTAADEEQRKAYETQLSCKLERKELPLGVKYHVFHDPVGPKIGNGGSTLVTFENLLKLYGEEKLSKSKVLMIHAGGFSQRLPSASVLGKIFTALPLGDPLFQMLELKLAMYIEFPQRMIPGVFITCADDIELFVSEGDWTFTQPGVTAMGHPSPVEIGTTHGVFALSDSKKQLGTDAVYQTTCSKFLHKPTIQSMKDHGIVFQCNDEDFVYTDSAFFLDWSTAKKLNDLFIEIQPIQCEICAYGDFLQALGPSATVDYTNNVANVTNETTSLVETRERIFHFLKGTQLNVLLFNESRFYHLGTTAEYIHHFCNDPVFRFELIGWSEVMVKRTGNPNKEPASSADGLSENKCLLHCSVSTSSSIGNGCVLEYCNIDENTVIGANSIVSNVHLPEGTEVPSNTFLHTVTVKVSDKGALFVTVAFGIDDNLKKTASESELGKLKYFDVPLNVAMKLYDVSQDTWNMVNLWHAKLFSVFESQEESVLHTVSMIHALKKQDGKLLHDCTPLTRTRYSMADVLAHKDIEGMLAFRNKLREKILS